MISISFGTVNPCFVYCQCRVFTFLVNHNNGLSYKMFDIYHNYLKSYVHEWL